MASEPELGRQLPVRVGVSGTASDVMRPHNAEDLFTHLPWRSPPEMVVVRRFASPVGHSENDARADGSGELDGLLDLLVRCSKLLRTCEVRNRSRFAMQGENQSQVHELLG